MSAWLYVVAALLDLAPAVYEYEARREFEPHLESCDPLADAICPRCNTLHALADWKCPSCKGVLSFDIHRVEGKRKVFGNCAACGVYAPDFTCTGCARNMTDRF